MRAVSPFEATLLRILQGLLGPGSVQHVLPLLADSFSRPDCLSRDAVKLVQDTLSKGLTLRLAREGGWRRERFLRGERAALGTLWERTPPAALGLEFSPRSLEFLIQITAVDTRLEPAQLTPGAQLPASLGDRLLWFFAYQAVRQTEFGPAWLRNREISGEPLLSLVYADDLARERLDIPSPDFSVWMTERGAWVIETLQPLLAKRWIEMENSKTRGIEAGHLEAEQRQQLGGFLEWCEQANRRDLARFMFPLVEHILQVERNDRESRPDSNQRSGMMSLVSPVLNEFVHRLERWEREARGIGYLDEGYAASQLWKADWQRWNGDELTRQAAKSMDRRTLRTLTPGTLP